MIDSLAGRPPAHLAARLARHVADDLLIGGSAMEWIFARFIDDQTLRQRVSRFVRTAVARRALACPVDCRRLDVLHQVPTLLHPAPAPVWNAPGAPAADVAFLHQQMLRSDAARALLALKGLPAPFALLDARGAWLFDPKTGVQLAVGAPPAGEIRWRFGPPSPARAASDIARRIHDALPDGTTDLPSFAEMTTAHARLRAGVSESVVEDLRCIFPLSGARLRIQRTPTTLAILLRITSSGRPHPLLFSALSCSSPSPRPRPAIPISWRRTDQRPT